MKQLKASTDYGMRFILYLAKAEKGQLRTSKEASEELNIPRDYLVQLALRMRQAGIIKAKVGVAGGYCLAKPADKIDLCELLDLFEVYGQKTRKLANKRNRPDVKEIVKLQESAVGCMEAFLGSITVQDILDADGDKEKMGRIIAENMISTGQEMKEKFSE